MLSGIPFEAHGAVRVGLLDRRAVDPAPDVRGGEESTFELAVAAGPSTRPPTPGSPS